MKTRLHVSTQLKLLFGSPFSNLGSYLAHKDRIDIVDYHNFIFLETKETKKSPGQPSLCTKVKLAVLLELVAGNKLSRSKKQYQDSLHKLKLNNLIKLRMVVDHVEGVDEQIEGGWQMVILKHFI